MSSITKTERRRKVEGKTQQQQQQVTTKTTSNATPLQRNQRRKAVTATVRQNERIRKNQTIITKYLGTNCRKKL